MCRLGGHPRPARQQKYVSNIAAAWKVADTQSVTGLDSSTVKSGWQYAWFDSIAARYRGHQPG
jgi:hypothetical protein